MTDPASLENVPTQFEGVYRPGAEDGPGAAPIAVFKGEVPEDSGTANVYVFRRLVETGDEFDFDGPDSVTIEVENIHREDGLVVGKMAVAASNPDKPAVFKDGEQFKHVVEAVTHADHLDMEPGDTTLSPEGARMLGFNATSQGNVLGIDLHEAQEPAAA